MKQAILRITIFELLPNSKTNKEVQTGYKAILLPEEAEHYRMQRIRKELKECEREFPNAVRINSLITEK